MESSSVRWRGCEAADIEAPVVGLVRGTRDDRADLLLRRARPAPQHRDLGARLAQRDVDHAEREHLPEVIAVAARGRYPDDRAVARDGISEDAAENAARHFHVLVGRVLAE